MLLFSFELRSLEMLVFDVDLREGLPKTRAIRGDFGDLASEKNLRIIRQDLRYIYLHRKTHTHSNFV